MAAPASIALAVMTAEPHATAILLAVVGVLIAISVLLSKVVERVGVPIMLLVLVLGMLGGAEGLGIQFRDYEFSMRIGTMALALILFDGGLNTSLASLRERIYPATVLATAGVALTGGLVAVFARALGLPWPESLLLGAVVSSTDAAVVFSILRGGQLALRPRVGQTLELESCINDPMAVILTTSIIQAMVGRDFSGW